MNAVDFCVARGYHGPFTGSEKYADNPEPIWRDCAECVRCGSTVNMRAEREKREAVATAACARVVGRIAA